ncbi:MAG: hypothetical protein PVG71_03785, partial [Anaerolineae bacterium]
MSLLAVVYTAIALWLAGYGLNAVILALLYLHHAHKDADGSGKPSSTGWLVRRPARTRGDEVPRKSGDELGSCSTDSAG